ncbi:hypothetical protein AAIB33_02500 [Microbacterium sp. AZCO]|uniref:hypothetical protein n=1 Tax=Microbacterium sp. AZCO TaxID=3142976 RepID=UPI0031F3527F
MKRIVYAGGEYLTGDAIADALLDYSEALAEAGSASHIEIPIVDAHGVRERATFLVGPSSQIVTSDVDTHGDELVDQEIVDRLERLTRKLRPIAYPSAEGAPVLDDYDASDG